MGADEYEWLYERKRVPEQQELAPEKPRRGFTRFIVLILTVWLVFLLAVPVVAWSQIQRVDARPEGQGPVDTAGRTYLLIGSDSRSSLSEDERKELGTGNVSGARTDTIMIMHVGQGPTVLVSLPRDSMVDVPGYGKTKLNAAYAYGGAELLVATVESETGLRMDSYVEIGLGGFAGIVDALGGVEICPKEAINDAAANLDIPAGCQHVDGKNALGYARTRKTFTTGDIQRVQNQREVLGAIARESKSVATIANPVRYWALSRASTNALIIGDDVGPFDLGVFAWNLSNSMTGSGLNCTVPIADFSVRWNREKALELFDLIRRDQSQLIGPNLCTQDGLPPEQ